MVLCLNVHGYATASFGPPGQLLQLRGSTALKTAFLMSANVNCELVEGWIPRNRWQAYIFVE